MRVATRGKHVLAIGVKGEAACACEVLVVVIADELQLWIVSHARNAKDSQAIAVIDQLLQEFPSCGPKDREDIVDGIDKCFTLKRGESDEGVPDNRRYLGCAVGLRELGPESADPRTQWRGDKRHRKDLVLQRDLILALGKTLDDKGRKLLVKTLVDKTPAIQAAAAEALGEWDGAEQDVRKDNFEELLKVLMSVKGSVDSDPNDTIARDRYDTISAPIITSLSRLSGQKIHDPNEWQHFWNKNKKEDWDALDG